MRLVQWFESGLREPLRKAPWQARGFAFLAVMFAAFRWLERREPWNSDDMDLFGTVLAAAQGKHWALGTSSISLGPVGPQIEHVAHVAFRVGLLPFAVPAVWLMGPTAAAYYFVPLLFSLVGFGALFWVAWRQFGPTVALGMSLLHLAWPFELEHASLLLTDLPAAAVSVVCLCLLDASARGSRRGRVLYTVLAGFAAWETYLLRNNGLVLLGPAFLVMLWNRDTRRQTLWALALAAVGVLAQQVLLVWRGFGWGYDWISVRRDFESYAPFLPVYSWPAFAVRQFRYQLNTFGHGVAGWLAAALMLGSLALHLLSIRFERRPLLRAIVLFGLGSWLVYSYSIYELVPGGVRATAPVNFRFIQPFTYSSLLVWAWAVWALRERLARAGAVETLALRLSRWVRLAIPSALAVFSVAALLVRAPETYRASGTRRLEQALDAALSGDSRTPATIAGLGASVRVPRMFCCHTLRQVEWREYTLAGLIAALERGEPTLVLRDIPRELSLARYLAPDERQVYRDEVALVDDRLWRGAELLYVDTTYALFALSDGGRRDGSSMPREGLLLRAPASFAPDDAEATCVVEPDSSGRGARRLMPREHARRGGWCQHARAEDARLLPARSNAEGGDDNGFVLRLRAEYDSPLSVKVDVVERSATGTERRRLRLPSGTSYVPLPSEPSERSVSLVYHIRNGDVRPTSGVRIYSAEWRARQGGVASDLVTPALSAEP